MKTYPLTSTLSGVLTDDYLYFEGTARPQVFYLLRDAPHEKASPQEFIELERYFNDLYNLFLRKLTGFACSGPLGDEESLKLQALLQELIKVKDLIENVDRVDIMGG